MMRSNARLGSEGHQVCSIFLDDNEAGKGDHKHVGDKELSYQFSNVDALLADFRSDVRKWLDENGRI